MKRRRTYSDDEIRAGIAAAEHGERRMRNLIADLKLRLSLSEDDQRAIRREAKRRLRGQEAQRKTWERLMACESFRVIIRRFHPKAAARREKT